jgi:hypothetical protein
MGARLKLTPLGVVLLLVFVAAVVLALVGSATEQVVGMVVAVFLALFVLGGAPLGRSGTAALSTLAARGATVREHQTSTNHRPTPMLGSVSANCANRRTQPPALPCRRAMIPLGDRLSQQRTQWSSITTGAT